MKRRQKSVLTWIKQESHSYTSVIRDKIPLSYLYFEGDDECSGKLRIGFNISASSRHLIDNAQLILDKLCQKFFLDWRCVEVNCYCILLTVRKGYKKFCEKICEIIRSLFVLLEIDPESFPPEIYQKTDVWINKKWVPYGEFLWRK